MSESIGLSIAVLVMVSGLVTIALHRLAAENWVRDLARMGIELDARIPSWCAIVIGSFEVLIGVPIAALTIIRLDEYTLSGRRAQFSYVHENWGTWMMWVALALLLVAIGTLWGFAAVTGRISRRRRGRGPFGGGAPTGREVAAFLLGMLLLAVGLLASMGMIWLLVVKSLSEALLG